MANKKCPACKKEYENIDSLSVHIESEHDDLIPNGWSGGMYYFNALHGRINGTCVICKRDTKFNKVTNKPFRLCENPKCTKQFRENFKRNMKAAGKENIMRDPEHQRKMLSNRSIAKDYIWSNGDVKRCIGSFEYDACKFLDIFMQLPSEEVIIPAPMTIEYEYEGEKHFYIPDIFLQSIYAILEIKDGGDNPNMHPKIQAVDKKKEKAKEEALKKLNYNYIKIENKQYGAFVNFFMELKNIDNEIKGEKFRPLIITNEDVSFLYDMDIEESTDLEIVLLSDKNYSTGLMVGDKILCYSDYNNKPYIVNKNSSSLKILRSNPVDLYNKVHVISKLKNIINNITTIDLPDETNNMNFPLIMLHTITSNGNYDDEYYKALSVNNIDDLFDYSHSFIKKYVDINQLDSSDDIGGVPYYNMNKQIIDTYKAKIDSMDNRSRLLIESSNTIFTNNVVREILNQSNQPRGMFDAIDLKDQFIQINETDDMFILANHTNMDYVTETNLNKEFINFKNKIRNSFSLDLDNIKESMEILSKLNCDNIEHLKYVGYPVIKENKNLDNDTSFIRSVISNSEFINEEFTSHIKGLNNEKLIKYKEYFDLLERAKLLHGKRDNFKSLNNEISNRLSEADMNLKPTIKLNIDHDGNILLARRKNLDFKTIFANSHEMLNIYIKTNNIEGMKYELAKLYMLKTILDNDIIYADGLKAKFVSYSKKKNALDCKSHIMADFKKVLTIISEKEPDFNFQEYFNGTDFGVEIYKIDKNMVNGIRQLFI